MQARPRVVNEIHIRLADISRSIPTAAMIEGRWGYKAAPWEETYSRILDVFVLQNAIIGLSTGSVLVVAAFGIFNIISTVVMEKARDVAILRSIGMAGRDVEAVFVIEGVVVGLLGIAAGAAAGLGAVGGDGALAGAGRGRSRRDAADRPVGCDLRRRGRHRVRRRRSSRPGCRRGGGAHRPARDHPRGHVTHASWRCRRRLAAGAGLTRVLPGPVPATLVAGIDLDFATASFAVITGPSGSGKSSLLYLLGLLDPPSAGDVLVDGASTAGLDGEARARVRLERFGFVFQFHFLLPEFSVLDNVMLPMRQLGRLDGAGDAGAGDGAAGGAGYAAAWRRTGRTRCRADSGSARRWRARSPMIRTSCWPMSRPGSLDTRNAASVFSILRGLAREGRTVIAVTHDEALAATADRRIRLVDGRLV